MRENEEWAIIDEFPDYAVSSLGQVMSRMTDLIKTQSLNQQGIPSVLLMRDRQQNRRAVAPLVANAFLDPPESDAFDTPINLNGNRLDNRATNLMWRPRWFAIAYHKDMLKPQIRRNNAYGYINTRDGRRFEEERDAAQFYGVRELEVYLSACNNEPVFPTWDIFRFDD